MLAVCRARTDPLLLFISSVKAEGFSRLEISFHFSHTDWLSLQFPRKLPQPHPAHCCPGSRRHLCDSSQAFPGLPTLTSGHVQLLRIAEAGGVSVAPVLHAVVVLGLKCYPCPTNKGTCQPRLSLPVADVSCQGRGKALLRKED